MLCIEALDWKPVSLICLDWSDTLTRDLSDSIKLLECGFPSPAPVVITSTGTKPRIERYLRTCGIDRFIQPEHIYTEGKKEDGSSFEFVARAFEIDVSSLLIVDDDIYVVRAAIALGIKNVVWLAKPEDGYACPENAYLISALSELRAEQC